MDESVNDLAYWFPRIEAAGLPVPETRIVTTDCALLDLLDGRPVPGFEAFLSDLGNAARQIGYPCFLRTGYLSGKHQWAETCHVPGANALGGRVFNLIEESALADLVGLPTNTWAVRALIPNVPLFTLPRYGGMPFVPEWRLFADAGGVTHVQPYWPDEALERGDPSASNWRDIVFNFFAKMPPEQAAQDLGPLAVTAANACGGGEWSVDFLWSAVTGSWWLTDMADGARSFRYDPAAE